MSRVLAGLMECLLGLHVGQGQGAPLPALPPPSWHPYFSRPLISSSPTPPSPSASEHVHADSATFRVMNLLFVVSLHETGINPS